MMKQLGGVLATLVLLFAGTADAATIPIAAARLTPSTTAEGLRWDARYIVDADAAWEFRGGTLPFAVPLPIGERVVTSTGVAAITEGDRIIGLNVAPEALHDRTIHAEFLAPPVGSKGGQFDLGAPIAAGATNVQIVEPLSSLDLALAPGFEKHVGYIAPRGVGHSAREEARRLTDTPARVSQTLTYVRGDDVKLSNGLRGKLVDPHERTRSGAAGVAFVFVTIVGGLVFAARRLRHNATIERAEQLLKDEIDRAA